MGRKKKQVGETSEENGNHNKVEDKSSNAYDNDTMIFICKAHELKEEGNRMFQKRDLQGAMVKYEKALKLLPTKHIDVSYVRSNMAACYMQMGLGEYPRAINECNLALEVTPKYSIALLKRARCYEALNRLDLALTDVSAVLSMEPNNIMALEISGKVKRELEDRGLRVNDAQIELPPDYVEPPFAVPSEKVAKEKKHKKKSKKEKVKATDEIVAKQAEEKLEEKKDEDNIEAIEAEGGHKDKKKANKSKKKAAKEKKEKKKDDVKEVNAEKCNGRSEDVPKKTAKLIFGDDIRWAQLPVNCSLFQLREVICDRFPSLGAVLVKYRDQEGDLITITSDEELKWAETGLQGSVRLYIVEANPNHDPFYQKLHVKDVEIDNAATNGCMMKSKEIIISSCIEDWVIQFAQLFKSHVGFESDRYLDFHELGMKLYSEAVEETITSEEAQGLFDMAGGKFQEMTAIALFNWGNVHMSRARKKVYLTDDSSKEHMHEQIKSSYEWAQNEYVKAGEKFEAAIKIKSEFFEGFLALGQQRFEQAKLSWYYALSSNIDLATWPSTEVLHLYNSAEENMEKGMLIWEESQEQQLSETSNIGLDRLFKNMSSGETASLVANMRSQINLLWGTMLYERSILEFKLGLPVWHESLEVSIEKFEHAGASPTDTAVMLKNHCSNNTAVEGLGFKIDEIVQAWNEMYEAKKLQKGVLSFRLEPLFRRRVSKIYHAFELV
ncbi:heat shock protein 70 (HSP70)-interacting protein [Trifolium pratense]|uniref:Heat shock protein 70 (HSP70)-interacting protein n=1 Tax=Trifolium pratense TaxID=57577 RepID=A0A2K3MW71_TRIPR|nr:heat shock protein 70 (HSP70)-interacting protein [Trifolium pratense]